MSGATGPDEAALAREIAALATVLRKQYSFWPSERGLLAWDVHRLIVLSRSLPIVEVPIEEIFEYDEAYWYGDPVERPTVRSLVEHMKLIEAATFEHPILLGASGRVMDGMHRVAKAHFQGRPTIAARRFTVDPEPDYVGRTAAELPY